MVNQSKGRDVATSSSKRGQFWRADWFVGVLVVLAVLVLHGATDFFGTLERRYYDFASTNTARQASDRIAIIAIDDQSIANIGRWPWPRDVHAELIDLLAAAKVKTIAHTAFFFEAQTDRGLVHSRKIKEALGPSSADPAIAPGGVNEQLGQLIAEAEVALDTDAKLATSLAKAGNVLLPSVFVLGQPQGKPDSPLPAYALKSAVDEQNNFSLPAWGVIDALSGGLVSTAPLPPAAILTQAPEGGEKTVAQAFAGGENSIFEKTLLSSARLEAPQQGPSIQI